MSTHSRWMNFLALALCAALTACGGSSDDSSAPATGSTSTSGSASPTTPTAPTTPTTPTAPTPTPTAPTSPTPPTTPTPPATLAPSQADASRFVDQATFGVTASDVAQVQSAGFDAYINQQLTAVPSQYTGFSYSPHTPPTTCVYDGTSSDASSICARDQYSSFQVQRQFFMHAITGVDQLRQRVAFALSQIFVVSNIEIYEAYGMADYQNMLLRDAFVNYRTLLQDVTLSPVMGHYLDMAQNAKANPAAGTQPNQNYGREVMQLMTIGLYQLNADGSQQVDAQGVPIPTYDQSVVEGFSAVFTGWTYPPLAGAASSWGNPINFDGTMLAFEAKHDTGAKVLLNGLTTSPNQTSAQDLQTALDDLYNHPNVGPFIGKQLIQHLVTSNPSPAYVARIAAVFANNGKGVRGDLGAVVKAILEDAEARGDAPASAQFGHLREPAQFVAGVFRSLGGKSDGEYLESASASMGQPVYGPPSVFNYYPPDYALPGSNTIAPEFGIDNAASALARANFINTVIVQSGAKADPNVTGSTGSSIDLSAFASITDPTALVTKLNQTLMHGTLSMPASTIIQTAAAAQGAGNALGAARTAAYLILSSGQYQVER